MTATWILGAAGVALLLLGPRLRHAGWVERSPKLAIGLWQALCLSAVAVPVLMGLTLLVPATVWVTDIAGWVHACAQSIQDAYGFHGDSLEPAIGLLISAATVTWTVGWVSVEAIGAHRDRRRVRDSLALISAADPRLGVHVVQAAAPAAFCVPGRSAQVVITSGALEVLTPAELAGVLAHERAHLNARHHIAVVLSQSLQRAFPRVGLFATATAQTRRLIEMAADDSAVQRVDRLSVASAIVRLASMQAPGAAFAMAGGAATHATTARVGRLLAPALPLERGRQGMVLVGVVALVGVPLLVTVAPTVVAALNHLCAVSF